ncbi:MAG: hypothetical protein UV73_C0013G0024 [Candidatus Gottesmanbacteria bacterium GW2011_GWA2_43_14]|uniref:Uncharacterized protein n=1 Tax=Candidatus Gottesmanbacteria bacterium GW2011_GWA2_43_14 TaxID=1618443 RepID=A0A0G1DE29_9BACT|nr:MAG: hypothetical protein UV73_C0013G0024 [Candidatus Gottesmanbacteria bacterium GW2011_GWA2_43_14]
MTLEAVRAEVTTDGILVDKETAVKGDIYDFTDPKIFSRAGEPDYIHVRASQDANSAHVTGFSEPGRSFRPSSLKINTIWEITIGRDPRYEPRVIFGDPAAVEVSYLGHPLRDTFEPLLMRQEKDFTTDIQIHREGRPLNHNSKWIIVATSPVLHTNIYGQQIDDDGQKPESGFTGKLMYVCEVKINKAESIRQPATVEFIPSIITLADSDELMRIYSYPFFEEKPTSSKITAKVLGKLAEVDLFFRSLKDKPNYFPWLESGFPLIAGQAFRDLIADEYDQHRRFRIIREHIIDNYGIDLQVGLNRLNQHDLMIEKQRLAEAVNINL